MPTATTFRRLRPVFGFCVLAGILAAASGPARAAEPGDGVPTFAGEVAAIFQAKCQVCHRPGMMAPMSLLTYQDARPWARSIRQRVMLREMPPWHLDKTVGISRYKGDRSLTDAQIDTIVRWVDGGAPLGDPADLPPALEFDDDEWTIGVPDLIVTSPEAVMYPEGSDWWPSYVVDVGLTETRYARAVETRPSREGREFVHHAITSLIDPDARDTPARLGQGEPVLDPLEGAYLSEYAPGKYGDVFPENTGRALKAGVKLRFSMHYFATGREMRDRTSVGFVLYPRDVKPKWYVTDLFIHENDTIDIPPGEMTRTDTYYRLPAAARIISYQPHLHLRGRAQCMEAIHGDGRVEMLSCVDRFDFNWHVAYHYEDDDPAEARRLGVAGSDALRRVQQYAGTVIESVQSGASEGDFTPVTDAMLQDPDPGDWLLWRRTLDGWGYSPLDQIDRGNVGELRMVWSRGLTAGRQQGTPLARGGVLYMPNPRDVIQALDAVTGDLIWEYRRPRPDDLEEYVLPILTEGNRNVAIHGDLIIDTSADDHVFALDAASGRLVWETQILDYRTNPAHQTSGPIIAGGKVVSGRGCMPEGGPEACVVTAHDARSGAELWRTRLIPAPGEPGDESWGGVPFEERRHVGAWMAPSFDPELNLIYVGTSVTSPAPKFMLGGADLKHLYHNSTLALDADTGDIAWYYQHLNDHWDLDHPFERILVDTAVAPDPGAVRWINPRLQPGERRQVVTGIPGKTGVVYTLDRATGEFLWATPTITQNVISHIDGATGAVSENAEVVFGATGQQVTACPTWYGGKDWEAGAYSPLTNTMYFPLRNTCAQMMATTTAENSFYALAVREQIAPGADELGTVLAISAETGAVAWRHDQRAATTSLVATGGGLVFGGDANGRFRAFDHETGEVLWEINVGSPVTGFPITYAVDGRQYVAVSTGNAGTTSAQLRLTPELRPSTGNNLFVFALP